MKQDYVFGFYLVVIIILALSGYARSNSVAEGLVGAAAGAGLSMLAYDKYKDRITV